MLFDGCLDGLIKLLPLRVTNRIEVLRLPAPFRPVGKDRVALDARIGRSLSNETRTVRCFGASKLRAEFLEAFLSTTVERSNRGPVERDAAHEAPLPRFKRASPRCSSSSRQPGTWALMSGLKSRPWFGTRKCSNLWAMTNSWKRGVWYIKDRSGFYERETYVSVSDGSRSQSPEGTPTGLGRLGGGAVGKT